MLAQLNNQLCNRVNEVPFPEPAEELRLLIAEIIPKLLEKDCDLKVYSQTQQQKQQQQEQSPPEDTTTPPAPPSTFQVVAFTDNRLVEKVISVLPKLLSDNFPAVKRACADLVVLLAEMHPSLMRFHAKALIKGLEVNALHQHSKTRSMTLTAIGKCLSCLSIESYERIITDSIYNLFHKTLTDRTSTVKLDFIDILSHLVISRLSDCQEKNRCLLIIDLQFMIFLLILAGDVVEDISKKAKISIEKVLSYWDDSKIPLSIHEKVNQEIIDGESALKGEGTTLKIEGIDDEEEEEEAADPSHGKKKKVIEPLFVTPQLIRKFFANYLSIFLPYLVQGVDNWTNEHKTMYIRALDVLIIYLQHDISTQKHNLLMILLSLSNSIRDEEHEIRQLVENTLQDLGHYGDLKLILEIVIPAITGQQQSSLGVGESIPQKSGLLLVLAQILKGYSMGRKLREGGESGAHHHPLSLLQMSLQAGAIDTAAAANETKNEATTEGEPAEEVPTTSLVVLLENLFYQLIYPANPSNCLLNYREVYLREAFLLFLRATIDFFPFQLQASEFLQYALVLSLVYLKGHVPGETDSVAMAAKKELLKLSFLLTRLISSSASVAVGEPLLISLPANYLQSDEESDALMNEYLSTSSSSSSSSSSSIYLFCLLQILFPNENIFAILSPSPTSSSSSSLSPWGMQHPSHLANQPITLPPTSFLTNFLTKHLLQSRELPQWTHHTIQRAAFESLIMSCLSKSWEYCGYLIPIIHKYTKPKEPPKEGSAEANMLSYASQRGEESIATNIEEIDIRLNFIILLENMIRYLHLDPKKNPNIWELSKYFLIILDFLMKEILLINLIWRVGRVEGTIRKIVLTILYQIMKLGCMNMEILSKYATELIPLLVHHLDDTESSIRLMVILTVTILFDRLPHCYSPETIHTLYPKIIARLDDNNDEIRIAICMTLEKFFRCATDRYAAYHNTMIDYILTQLFIHLDDINEHVQEAVFRVLVVMHEELKDQCDHSMLSRCESCRLAHRTSKYCDQLIFEIRGVEVLES
jgi:hypothetical protein